MATMAASVGEAQFAVLTPRAWAARLLMVLATLFALAATAVAVSWHADRARLRRIAEAVVAGQPDEAGRLTHIVDWVYHNQGFDKNHRFFLWNRLEATPVQILEHGGDCADKSRLTAAMLRELGVPASLAMVRSCPTCAFGHTVTLVQTRAGWTPVDSVYDITFPEGHGRFTPIDELRADPAIQARRIAQMRVAHFPDAKILYFSIANDPFTYVTTINWDKNALTRAVAQALRAAGGVPWRTPRPRFMDDPKLFFSLFFGGLALLLGIAALLAKRRALAPLRPLP